MSSWKVFLTIVVHYAGSWLHIKLPSESFLKWMNFEHDLCIHTYPEGIPSSVDIVSDTSLSKPRKLTKPDPVTPVFGKTGPGPPAPIGSRKEVE